MRGDFDDCLRLVEEASAAARRLPAQLDQSVPASRGRRRSCSRCSQQLGWEPPDWIVLPAGNLGNTAAFGKALLEAHRWGLISRLPRLAAVQAAGAAPFARSFAEDFEHALRGAGRDRRDGHPDRRPGVVRARGARHPGDGRRRARGDRRRRSSRPRPWWTAAAWAASRRAPRASPGVRELVRRGTDGAGAARGGGAHGPHPQGPGILLKYHREMEPPPPGANRPIEIEPTLRRTVERVLAAVLERRPPSCFH